MMTTKEYLIAVALGFFSFFGWLILLSISFEMAVKGESVAIINWYNMGNVYYIFGLCFGLFSLTIIFMVYYWRFAGAEKEWRKYKKEQKRSKRKLIEKRILEYRQRKLKQ